MTPEQTLLERLGVAVCPECGRAVQSDPQPASGWIAKCGRRIAALSELGAAKCPEPKDDGE